MLIVEDEAIIAFELKVILERAGYVVTDVAYTAEEAMKAAEAERPDVILMDVLLKGEEDGIHIAERINGLFKVPILFITGNTHLINEESIKNTENFIIMTKPPLESDIIKNVQLLSSR